MGAWIEIRNSYVMLDNLKSHPTMGAWIEIIIVISECYSLDVAPHDGCVD